MRCVLECHLTCEFAEGVVAKGLSSQRRKYKITSAVIVEILSPL